MAVESHVEPMAVIERMREAIDAHDLEAMAACFAPDYDSKQPLHPDRAFTGREQMRKNWTQIFGAVPDITATIVRQAQNGDTIWVEWEWRGTHRDGSPHLTRGVTIQGIEDGQVAWVRLYMERVAEGSGVDEAIQRHVRAGEGSAS